MAYAITLAELAYFAAVATALVTRSERSVLAWTTPSWLVAALAITGWWPPGWVVRVEWLLVGAIALTVARAFRHIATPATGTGIRTRPADLGRALAYLLIGAGQALAFVLVWRAAPGGSATPPAALPLLASVPLLEIFVGWYTARLAAGLDACDDPRAYRTHVRWVALVTVAFLLPPLSTGIALGAGAYRLPLHLADHADAANTVLALAAGVLLAGVFAIVLLLATRRRLATAALLASAPAALAIGLSLAPPATVAGVTAAVSIAAAGPGRECVVACVAGDLLLPNTVVALTVVYVVGMVIATYVLLDTRSCH